MKDVCSTVLVVMLPHRGCGNGMIRIALSYRGVEMRVSEETRGGWAEGERGKGKEEKRKGEQGAKGGMTLCGV